MSIATYRKKRKAGLTPEPGVKASKTGEKLIFVVQKHQASHLHYDFRLELDGVLKSWAIPKGPSTHPEDKRLAVMVEDHPYEYKDFAGVIPKGNYGAGTVEIWDKGTYVVEGVVGKSETEQRMREGLKKGHINIVLKGKKLKGEFNLVKIGRGAEEKAWLLIAKGAKLAAAKKTKTEARPERITPMLAELVETPFNKKDWLFEVKWDGYRAIAKVSNDKVRLISRNQKTFEQFPTINEELKELSEHAPILDGELVILDADGRSNFQLMQKYQRTREGNLAFYVFDLLYCDGRDLRDRPLIERKERLEVLLAPLRKSHVRYSDHVVEKGVALFAEAEKLGLEGIIAKNAESGYQMKRSRDWLKIKTRKQLELVIGGFTAPQNSRSQFGSLMVGVLEGKTLRYVGNVGSGFSEAGLKEVAAKLAPLVAAKSPFASHPKLKTTITYVKPKLSCTVSFAEWTEEGLMRHPVFEGLRVHTSR